MATSQLPQSGVATPILSSGEDGRSNFFVKFVITIPSLIVALKPLPHFPSHVKRWVGHLFGLSF